MFHAPTTEAKKQNDFTRVPFILGQEPSGTPGCSVAASHRGGSRRLARLHSMYGNQAVLRLLNSGQTPTSSKGVLQPKCACGGQCRQSCEKRATIPLWPVPAASHASTSKFRCADDDCPEDEPQLHRDFLGLAICNDATGVVDITVSKEHCAGNCVAQHEATHAEDMALCCERFGLCMSNAPDLGGRMKCRNAWDGWFHLIDDWTECNAYNREGQCLTSLINRQCRGGGAVSVSEDCCANLQQQLDFVTRKISEHCPNAVPFPCPFTEDGQIVAGLLP